MSIVAQLVFRYTPTGAAELVVVLKLRRDPFIQVKWRVGGRYQTFIKIAILSGSLGFADIYIYIYIYILTFWSAKLSSIETLMFILLTTRLEPMASFLSLGSVLLPWLAMTLTTFISSRQEA